MRYLILAVCIAVASASCSRKPPDTYTGIIVPPPDLTARTPPKSRAELLADIPAADSAEYAPFLTAGDASLAGQAFLTTRGGDVKRAAGKEVILDPATSFARRWWDVVGEDREAYHVQPKDPLVLRARRIVKADADGRFRFTGLPAGTYVLRTFLTWTADGYSMSEGGVIGDTITLASGVTREVILNELRR